MPAPHDTPALDQRLTRLKLDLVQGDETKPIERENEQYPCPDPLFTNGTVDQTYVDLLHNREIGLTQNTPSQLLDATKLALLADCYADERLTEPSLRTVIF